MFYVEIYDTDRVSRGLIDFILEQDEDSCQRRAHPPIYGWGGDFIPKYFAHQYLVSSISGQKVKWR